MELLCKTKSSDIIITTSNLCISTVSCSKSIYEICKNCLQNSSDIPDNDVYDPWQPFLAAICEVDIKEGLELEAVNY